MEMPAISTGLPTKRPRPELRAASIAGLLLALSVGIPVHAADPPLLPPEQAFRFSARALDERTVEARFIVADGYYLYRDKLGFVVAPDKTAGAAPALPPGMVKDDQFFGKVETYRGDVVVALPLATAVPGQSIVVTAQSQGCADLGVCYPPNLQKVTLIVPAQGKGPGPVVEAHPQKKRWFN